MTAPPFPFRFSRIPTRPQRPGPRRSDRTSKFGLRPARGRPSLGRSRGISTSGGSESTRYPREPFPPSPHKHRCPGWSRWFPSQPRAHLLSGNWASSGGQPGRSPPQRPIRQGPAQKSAGPAPFQPEPLPLVRRGPCLTQGAVVKGQDMPAAGTIHLSIDPAAALSPFSTVGAPGHPMPEDNAQELDSKAQHSDFKCRQAKIAFEPLPEKDARPQKQPPARTREKQRYLGPFSFQRFGLHAPTSLLISGSPAPRRPCPASHR